MKVLLWSPIAGQSGTTSTAVTVSLMLAWQEKRKVLLVNAQHKNHALERCLLSVKNDNIDILFNMGMDVCFRNLKLQQMEKENISNAALAFHSGNLQVIGGSMLESLDQFEEEMLQFPRILNVMNEEYEFVMIDAPAGINKTSEMLIKEADLIVVTLPQNRFEIDNYFSRFDFDEAKVLYTIGSYNDESKYKQRNLERIYKKFKGKITCIPYNVKFKDAISESAVIRFLQKNIDREGKDKDLINKIKIVSNQIIKKKGGMQSVGNGF